jgi:hypothetical protein
MNKNTLRQALVVLAVLATLTVNGLANALPINNLTQVEISDRFEVFFIPAGYVFSIWGLIYVGMIAFAVYQALPSQRENRRLARIAWPFLLASLANITWLFLWHYEFFVLSLGVMVALLLSLIVITLRLVGDQGLISQAERWVVDIFFSVYLGWISVATISNATIVLDYLGWGGWGLSEQLWTVIMLGVGAVLAWIMSLARGDSAFVMVIIWAFAGIAVKHADSPMVASAAWVATGAASLALAASVVIRRGGGTSPLPGRKSSA